MNLLVVVGFRFNYTSCNEFSAVDFGRPLSSSEAEVFCLIEMQWSAVVISSSKQLESERDFYGLFHFIILKAKANRKNQSILTSLIRLWLHKFVQSED